MFQTVENLKVLIRRHIEGAALVSSTGVEMSFRLPACPDTYSSFEKLCRELDANLDRLGVSSYGLSDTTLEEVFLKASSTYVPRKQQEALLLDRSSMILVCTYIIYCCCLLMILYIIYIYHLLLHYRYIYHLLLLMTDDE